MSSDRRRKEANATDVTSKRHAMGLVLRMTEEASKRNRRDFKNAREEACPQTYRGCKQTEQTLPRSGTQWGLSLDRQRKQANETDVTSMRHAKALVLRQTEEASKRNRRDFKKASERACPLTD